MPFLLPQYRPNNRIDPDAQLIDVETIDQHFDDHDAGESTSANEDVSDSPFLQHVPAAMRSTSQTPKDQIPIPLTLEQYHHLENGKLLALKTSTKSQLLIYPCTSFEAFRILVKQRAGVAESQQTVMKVEVKLKGAPYLFLGIFGLRNKGLKAVTKENWEDVKAALEDGVAEGFVVRYWVRVDGE